MRFKIGKNWTKYAYTRIHTLPPELVRSIVRIDGYDKQQQTDRRTNRPTSIDAIERDIYGDGNA